MYALLFGDHGVSLGQISTLFIIWSVTSFVFEIPSGAWADTIDRRHLLVLSAVIYAGAFSSCPQRRRPNGRVSTIYPCARSPRLSRDELV